MTDLGGLRLSSLPYRHWSIAIGLVVYVEISKKYKDEI